MTTTATKTRKPAMTAEEKKARATAKKQSNLTILGRAEYVNQPGRALIGIEDRNGKEPVRMHVTILNGRVTGCENAATGEECQHRHWSGHCCHGDRALKYECARDAQLAESVTIVSEVLPEMAAHQDVEQHVADSVRSGELSWVEQQRQARAGMTPDEREEQLLALGARRWMAA